MNRIPRIGSTMGPQSTVPPLGPLHIHSAGVTFQHLPDPIIIQRSLYELVLTDDGYRHNKDSRWLQTKSRGHTLSISFGSVPSLILQVLILESESLMLFSMLANTANTSAYYNIYNYIFHVEGILVIFNVFFFFPNLALCGSVCTTFTT